MFYVEININIHTSYYFSDTYDSEAHFSKLCIYKLFQRLLKINNLKIVLCCFYYYKFNVPYHDVKLFIYPNRFQNYIF